MKSKLIVLLGAFYFCVLSLNAEIRLPAIFGNNMILQQQSEVLIWGWAKSNTKVYINESWSGKTYVTNSDSEGRWKKKIRTPHASKKEYSLTISDGAKTVLNNILIGEVWLCSGQSNMEMPMQGFPNNQPIEGSLEAINSSANRNIRLFTIERVSTTNEQDDCMGKWQSASPATVARFSATAYFFGRLIFQNLDIPIGLIHSSWGGSKIEAWMSADAMKDFPDKKIPKSDDEIKSKNQNPTLLYNGMIKPITGFGMRGAMWYQGESNRNEPDLYPKMFDRMVGDWREKWGIGDFPLYYAQIAPYMDTGDRNITGALFREAQEKCMTITHNTGMAVLMDSDSPKGIHPSKKKNAGERLAYWALAETYGFEDMMYKSPQVSTVNTEGRVMIISFDLAANPGLTSFGKNMENFEIAGADKKFYPAKAEVYQNKVYLFSSWVEKPVAARYCFRDGAMAELYTAVGIPLSSFRTDDW